MKTFTLLMTVILGDPETGPVHEFTIDYELSHEDCQIALKTYRAIWLGNNSIGMRCDED